MVKVIFMLFFAIAAGALASQLARVLYGRHEDVPACVKVEPFIVSDYLEEMDRALVDILQKQEPVDQIIILWWGLDGLTLDENGELKWISRKKPKPVNQNVSYQPQQGICQSPAGIINDLQYQNTYCQTQASPQAQIANLIAQTQTCCVPPPKPAFLNAYPEYSVFCSALINGTIPIDIGGCGGNGGPAVWTWKGW